MSPHLAEKLFWVLGWVYDFTKWATVILLVGLVVHFFVLTALVVRGTSMEPNYKDGEILLVDKIGYRFQDPSRGEVVAMFFPGETEKRFIKRIIGLPGELVQIRSGRVLINGQLLEESYLEAQGLTAPELDRQLQADEYFVLGDNRLASSDSRAWGSVPRSFIIGRITSDPGKLLNRSSVNQRSSQAGKNF